MIPPNLLVNPGAESGSLADWTQTTSSHAIVDSNEAFNSGFKPYSGSYCFTGEYGPGSPSRLVQNVQLLN
ncbi:unnamed protein product, partial [Rotaria sordida]